MDEEPASVGTPLKRYTGARTFDAIVIGSGIGGLGAAALLARMDGRRVAVLERHYTAGGMTHVFRRPGYEWDVGVHYVGEMERESPTRALLEYLTEGRLDWHPMPDAYDRVILGDTTFDYVRGADRLREALKDRFPAEHRAIDRYFAVIERVVRRATLFFAEKTLPAPAARVAGGLMRWPFVTLARHTTGHVLDRLTANAELKAILTAQWGDYGLPPGQSSLAAHAIVTRHYFNGASFPVGGASRIAAAVWPTIARAGGVLVTDADVARIDVSGGRATGITLANGSRFDAPVVISDAGVANTIERLLTPETVAATTGLRHAARHLPPSTGHLSLYVGLDAPVPVPSTNLWILAGPDHDANVGRYLSDRTAPFPFVYVSWPSAKDPTSAARLGGRATAEVITVAPYERYAPWADTRWKRRGHEYDDMKASLSERLLDAFYAHVPAARGHVATAELSTPLSTRHFANYRMGEMYGLAHTPGRFLCRDLRPQTAIRGLFLTGQDVTLCGVMGALSGAYVCASAVLRRNAFRRAQS